MSLTSFYQFLRILAILLLVPGGVQLGECFTGSASEIEEEVDTLAVVVAEKHCETAAARSFMELVLRWGFKFACFVVLWGKFIAGLSGEASWERFASRANAGLDHMSVL